MKHLFAALILVLLAAPAYAQDPKKGIEAYERGDYAAALREIRPLAEQGDATAQFNLGLMYSLGQGVPQDSAAAVEWYRLAAGQGYADAQNNFSVMFANGQGVLQDFVQAHMWLSLAAAQGHAFAIEGRDLVANLMTPAQIADARRRAREWLEAHPG